MASTQITQSLQVFTDLTGQPLDAGYIYVGQVNQNPETSPIAVYWDAELTQPAAQPLRTVSGYISRQGTPADVYAASSFSITVKTKNSELVYYRPTPTSDSTLRLDLSSSSGASLVGFTQSATGAVAHTVQDKLSESISVKDFGAKGNGVTDDTAAINAALLAASGTYKKSVFIPAGYYITTGTINIPVGVQLHGEGAGWMSTGFGYLAGSVIRKNHSGNAITVTGAGGNNDVGGGIIGVCVVSDSATYTTGAGVFIDGVQHVVVRDVVVSKVGGDSFVLGSTNTSNYTTYVTAENCYANTAGTGKAFNVNSRWSRLNQCISDGGSYGLYMGPQAQSCRVDDFHCEFVTNNGIYLTGAGRNQFSKLYVSVTSAATAGIALANVAGTQLNSFTKYHITTSAVTAGQFGITLASSQNANCVFSDGLIEMFETGYKDLGNSNTMMDTIIYNCKYPMVMGSTNSRLTRNTTSNTVAAGGTWAINHIGGTTGEWVANTLDGSNANGLINPGVTGVVGNFSGIKARDNAGFVTRTSGTTVAITTGTAVSHGLAGSPGGAGAGVLLSTYTGGITSAPQIGGVTSTQFTINWTGTANAQWNWVAYLPCDA